MYKHELIHAGIEINQNKEMEKKNQDVIKDRKDYFNDNVRKVMLSQVAKNNLEDHSVDMDEIKEDFQKLSKNEDIPDWYLDDNLNKNALSNFDIE